MEKKVKSILILLQILIMANTIVAQNLQLYIKKGTALKNGSLLQAGTVTEIQPKDEVSVSLHSLAFILDNNKIAELTPGKTYKLDDLRVLTKNKAGYSKAFVNVILNQDYSHKPKSGISMRGDSRQDLWFYQPIDSCTVLDEKLHFIAGTDECRFLSKIVVEGPNYLDSITTIDKKLDYEWICPKPGMYTWIYQLQCYGVLKTFKNVFIAPDKAKRIAIMKEIKDYRSSLSDFTEEMQEHLMREFQVMNRICF
jgi:hypothetical protein